MLNVRRLYIVVLNDFLLLLLSEEPLVALIYCVSASELHNEAE